MILQTWGGNWHALGFQGFQGFLAFLQENGPELRGGRLCGCVLIPRGHSGRVPGRRVTAGVSGFCRLSISLFLMRVFGLRGTDTHSDQGQGVY